MKVAIIGSGISGLSAAYYLHKDGHDVSVFEREDRIGGHTATIDVQTDTGPLAVDTGFIVFNDWTYPNFQQLLAELNVASRPTRMSFSVSCSQSGLEYAGSNLDTLFAQRRNLASPRFLRMLGDIVRFNRQARADLERGLLHDGLLLGDYLQANGYSDYFVDKYLIPMGAAIWSSGTTGMREFPVRFFVEFFKNHGLLAIKNRPQWYVIDGGSRTYLEPLTRNFASQVFTGTEIQRIQRYADHVTLSMSRTVDGVRASFTENFDALVIATHSDQALAMLDDAQAEEQEILGAIDYQPNEVVLHTDTRLLPRNRKTWSAWNYALRPDDAGVTAAVTYNMNILQGLATDTTYCVSLNQTSRIDPGKIIGEYEYSHPVFGARSMRAKKRWEEIAGVRRTWYCGAYWHNGFHEDGVVSGKRVADSISQLVTQPGQGQQYNERQDVA